MELLRPNDVPKNVPGTQVASHQIFLIQNFDTPVGGSSLMRIDGKISAGYAIVCNCGAAFAAERLGVAVECPSCGRTALGADIAVDYYLRGTQRRASAAGGPMLGRASS